MTMSTYFGNLMFHSETGTEGGYWAMQDRCHVHTALVDGKCPWGSVYCPVARGVYHEHARYEGLHVLKNGDYLKVFRGADVVWEGEINLIHHSIFTEDVGGLWIHADQFGVDRNEWASMFFNEMNCELVTNDNDD